MSHRGYSVTSQIRERRRKAAAARQTAYDALTLDQKLERLPPEPAAKRQRARLLHLKQQLAVKKNEKKK